MSHYARLSPTYPELGATRSDPLPSGYRHLRLSVRGRFDRAALLDWRMHERAGLHPVATSRHVAPGATVVCRLGPLVVPCRVIWIVDEPGRTGFAYGTLPGHPETGEEAFLLDGDTFTISAFSRPGRWFTRAAGPLAVLLQHHFARRYAAALRTET
ncbi:MAG: DUF1990 domain-containing protein [Nonomuraea sp.]|nr:DUF1990 domain-containing protein [Nonomuraea sp.]